MSKIIVIVSEKPVMAIMQNTNMHCGSYAIGVNTV